MTQMAQMVVLIVLDAVGIQTLKWLFSRFPG